MEKRLKMWHNVLNCLQRVVLLVLAPNWPMSVAVSGVLCPKTLSGV